MEQSEGGICRQIDGLVCSGLSVFIRPSHLPWGRRWGLGRVEKIKKEKKKDEKGEQRWKKQVEIKGIKGGKTAGDYRGVWRVQMG